MVRASVVIAALCLLAAVCANTSGAASQSRYSVTFSATETATITSEISCPGVAVTTLHAAIKSIAPLTAVLKAGKLTFSPDLDMTPQPLTATADVEIAACAGSAAGTCGPTTNTIKPGLEALDVYGGTLHVGYDSNLTFFPGPDPGRCSSGLMESPMMSAPINVARLGTGKTVTGTYSNIQTFVGTNETDVTTISVQFVVRFKKL